MIRNGNLNSSVRKLAVVALAFAMASAFALPDFSKNINSFKGQTATNLRLPIKRFENGKVKELLLASSVAEDDDGLCYAEGGISLVMFDERGKTNGTAHAKTAVYNPYKNILECPGKVTLDMPVKRVFLEGTNLVWKSNSSVVSIQTNAILRFAWGGKSLIKAMNR